MNKYEKPTLWCQNRVKLMINRYYGVKDRLNVYMIKVKSIYNIRASRREGSALQPAYGVVPAGTPRVVASTPSRDSTSRGLAMTPFMPASTNRSRSRVMT